MNYHRIPRRALLASLATLAAASPSLAAIAPQVPPPPPQHPDGRIAFESDRTGNLEIWTMDPDGKSLYQATRDPASDFDPDISPDGEQIVFTSDRDDFDHELYVMNADGSELRRLTKHPGFDVEPSFSRDGKWIAFSSERDGNFDIYMIRPDGSDLRRVTSDPAADRDPDLSRDGSSVLFSSDRDGNQEIYRATGKAMEVNLTNNPADDTDPAFSPSGSKIAFTSTRSDDDGDIYVQNIDMGTLPKNLTDSPGAPDQEPVFSPDGQRIAWATDPYEPVEGGRFEVFTMNASDGGKQANITKRRYDWDAAPSWGGGLVAYPGPVIPVGTR